MTKIEALNYAINAIGNDNSEVATILEKMVAQLSKSRTASPEAKAKASAKRKEQTAEARKELVAKVASTLRKYLTEDFSTAKSERSRAQQTSLASPYMEL